MVDRTSWSVLQIHKKHVDLLHVRYMEKIGKKITLTEFLKYMIQMCNDHLDLLEDDDLGPLIRDKIKEWRPKL